MERKLRKEISVIMDLPFAAATKAFRDEFIEDLSFLSGTEIDGWTRIKFFSGCIFFNGVSDTATIEAVVDLIKSYKDNPNNLSGEQRLIVEEFILKYRISSVRESRDLEPRRRKGQHPKGHVIFVHGFTGDEATFGDFPQFIKELTGLAVHNFVYPSFKLFRRSPSLTYVRSNLENFIKRKICTDGGELAFAAHSMGGVIVKDLLTSQRFSRNPLDEMTRQVTFFAAPQKGSSLASVASKIPIVSKGQVADLSPNSSYQLEVGSRWNGWRQQDWVHQDNIRSIVAEKDKVVSMASAMGDDSRPVIIFGKNHREIVKPTNQNDEVVETLTMFLREARMWY